MSGGIIGGSCSVRAERPELAIPAKIRTTVTMAQKTAWTVTIMVAVALGVRAQAGAVQLRKPAAVERMHSLFERLRSNAPVSFRLGGPEINDYLQYSLQHTPRPGLQSCNIKIFPQNYISTFTVVDFDAVDRWSPGAIPALLRPVLRGRRSIWVDCRFGGANGKLSFSVQKAYFERIRLPSVLVEQVIAILARQQPERFDTSRPVPIPFGLVSLWTDGNELRGMK